MTSTAAAATAQHATQPLNFGPGWLRALSTPDSASSIPSSGGSGNVFKFSATRHRYSKDEILALRSNVSKTLSEDVRNEIVKNLKEVENIFRPNIIDPLSLTAPTADETADMNSLSSYTSGRTSNGASRAGHGAQQPHSDAGSRRGVNSVANGRAGPKGKDGRETTYKSNRNNPNISEENSENGHGAADEASSSRTRGIYHPRTNPLRNQERSFDERKKQSEDSSASAPSSASWKYRNEQTRRSSGSTEQHSKFNDKRNPNDDRFGSSNSYKSNQTRGNDWRAHASMVDRDRDMHSGRLPTRREPTPEWADDNLDDDADLGAATFENDGTFTRISTAQQSHTEKQSKPTSKSASDSAPAQIITATSQQKDEKKSEEPTAFSADTAALSAPTVSTAVASQLSPSVQKIMSSLDNDSDHHDLATNVVESTLAEIHDYSPPVSARPTPRPISIRPAAQAATSIPQQQQQSLQSPVTIDDKQWFYKDPQNTVQGPFSSADMERWFAAGYFTILLPVKRLGELQFSTIQKLTEELGRLPFRTEIPSQSVQPPQQTSAVSGAQKNNSMSSYTAPSASNDAYIDEYLIQQHQSRQNVQNLLSFNRQSSMPFLSNDRASLPSPSHSSSQSPKYAHSQQQTPSQLTPNAINDPAIIYRQQQQRSSLSGNQGPSNVMSYEDFPSAIRQLASQPYSNKNASFFPSNPSPSHQTTDIMSRLTQAMQVHGLQQQQDKPEEHRRSEPPSQRDLESERLRLYRLAEQERLKRQEEEIRQRHELPSARQMMGEQFGKPIDYKKSSVVDKDTLFAMQQSLQYQKEQQAQIEAQKAENVRRYQQHYRESAQQPGLFRMPDATHWTGQPSYSNDQSHSSQLLEMQKHEQEQERRLREVASAVLAQQQQQQQQAHSETLSNSYSSSSSVNKTSSWAQTLFPGSCSDHSSLSSTSNPPLSGHDVDEQSYAELSSPSAISGYNQQATDAVLSLLNIHPKTRSITGQSMASWNATHPLSNSAYQDVQRQQQHAQHYQQQQQNVQNDGRHQFSSTPMSAWDEHYSRSTSSQQPPSSFLDNQRTSSAPGSNKPSYVPTIR